MNYRRKLKHKMEELDNDTELERRLKEKIYTDTEIKIIEDDINLTVGKYKKKEEI